ncbi:MAG: hypothetical protein OXU20_18735, partial [Myxococcales bacterium]|nr:hypothetical protein [Myxococcales bacterium]
MFTMKELFGATLLACMLCGARAVHADYDYVDGNQCDTMTTDPPQEHRKAFLAAPADRPHGGIQAENFLNVICTFPGRRIHDSGHENLRVSVYAYGRGGTTLTCNLDVTDHIGRPLVETATVDIDFPALREKSGRRFCSGIAS